MADVDFAIGLWDKLEAKCPICEVHQPLTTGYVTSHLSGPACSVCHNNFKWEDGRPMLLFPSNIGRLFARMKDVYEERPKQEKTDG